MPIHDLLVPFAAAVRADRAANPRIAGDGTKLELLIAPTFRTLIQNVLAELGLAAPPAVLPEYNLGGVGRPDLALSHAGQPARAFIELKEPGSHLDTNNWRSHDADQFRRFCELPVWALSNYTKLRLFRRGVAIDEADILPAPALDPATSKAHAERLIRAQDTSGVARIVLGLAMAEPPAPRDAAEIAETLAHAARLVREIVAAQCAIGLSGVLADVRAEFNETLFARPEAGGYDPKSGGDIATGTVEVTVTNPATVINGPEYGFGTIEAASGASIINASGYSNIIYDRGGNDVVNAGSGQATVYVDTGDVVVNLAGYGNLVVGFDEPGAAAATGADGNVRVSGSVGTTTVELGNGDDTVSLAGEGNTISLGDGSDVVGTGQSDASVSLGNGNDRVTLGGYTNTVTAGNGNDQVSGAEGGTTVTLGDGNDTVSLGGDSNVIKVGNGQDTIAAGAGSDQVSAGGGNDTITLQGWANRVTLGAGTDTVNAGSGDTITLNGSTLLLKGGTQEMVFLGAGTASLDDLSAATTVVADSTSGSANILDFAKDPGFVLDLKDGVGGYTSSASVVSALQSDGHGGTQLLLGSGAGAPVIDFVNTPRAMITSGHFAVS